MPERFWAWLCLCPCKEREAAAIKLQAVERPGLAPGATAVLHGMPFKVEFWPAHVCSA